jgi:hypothetical protein
VRRSIFVTVGIVFLLTAFAFAQDADDPGAPDSLIFGGVELAYNPGQDTYVDVPVYFVTDDSIASLMLPVEWASTDGNISVVSATWNNTFEDWEDTYHSDDFAWYVGFHDLTGDDSEPLLFTDGSRMQGLTLEFHISGDAEEQFVPVGIGQGPHGFPVNLGLFTATSDEDITPVVVPGYIRYGAVSVDDDNSALPTDYAVRQNYPNPFNPETNFEYQLPKAGHVSIEIYNILGQNVRNLLSADQEAGVYTAHWNGMNNNGARVPSGIYFYRVTAGEFSAVKKMIMLK